MKTICPNCEKESTIELAHTKEDIEVRGDTFVVDVEFFKCLECGEGFENTRGVDALEVAYDEYRRKHKMLRPEEIREWRRRYGLTQRELSELLGWGGATLSRYENGALHSDAHEKVLRLAMEPRNLLKLMEETPDALGEDKRGRLINELHAAEEETCSYDILFEERFGRYDQDVYSGFKKLNLSKLFNAILFFCKEGQYVTKLNKLLFYADFKHFKDYTVSITGIHYVHLPYGPIPDNYDFYYANLRKEKKLLVKEVQYDGYVGENRVTQVEPNMNIFEDTELKVLLDVKEYFQKYNSTQIRDFSHKERAYRETDDGETISYTYANDLRI